MPATAADGRPDGDVRRYRVAELAEMWNLDKSTVYRLIYDGLLTAERHGRRRGAIRVTETAAARYIASAAAEPVAS